MQDELNPFGWGWKQELFALWMQEASSLNGDVGGTALVPARVIAKNHHQYDVVCPDFSTFGGFLPPSDGLSSAVKGFYSGVTVTGRFEYEASCGADFPVTGDWAAVVPAGESVRIVKVLRRLTTLSRAKAGKTTEEQVLASNIDTLLIVNALDGGRNFLPTLIERALAVCHHSLSQPHIILNKADLASAEYIEEALMVCAASFPTVPCTAVSAKTGQGLDELSRYFTTGTTVGMIGKSGAGKSALVNALSGLRPALEGEVREGDLRGRHTTTSSRLYRLPSGILIIDSPGIRELKIWGDADDIDNSFDDISLIAQGCRFRDCAHSGEPGCAVQAALASGELDQKRYLMYLELSREAAWLKTRTDENARRDYENKWKKIKQLANELRRR